MPKTITVEPELVDEKPVKANSRKREVTAVVSAGVVTCILGLAATAIINRIGETVKTRIAPEPEKEEDTESK